MRPPFASQVQGLTQRGLCCLGALSSLRSLQVLTAAHPLDDDVLSSLSGLYQMEQLHLCNIKACLQCSQGNRLPNCLYLHACQSVQATVWDLCICTTTIDSIWRLQRSVGAYNTNFQLFLQSLAFISLCRPEVDQSVVFLLSMLIACCD